MAKKDPDEYRRLRERGEAARKQMQDIIDRQQARRRAREEWNQLSFFRRLITPRP